MCYLFLLSFDFTAKPQCNNGANYFYFHLILLPNRSADEFYKNNYQQLYCWCIYILHIYFPPYRSYKSVSTYLINLHKQHSEFTLLVIRIFCVTEYATKEKKEHPEGGNHPPTQRTSTKKKQANKKFREQPADNPSSSTTSTDSFDPNAVLKQIQQQQEEILKKTTEQDKIIKQQAEIIKSMKTSTPLQPHSSESTAPGAGCTKLT